MSFKKKLTPQNIPNKEDIDHLSELLKKDTEGAFAPLQNEDIGWIIPVDDPDTKIYEKRTTRYDFLETLTQAARDGIEEFIGDDAVLRKSDLFVSDEDCGHGEITRYRAVMSALENSISKVIHSPEFSENIAREIAKQQLYRGNDELVELERKVVDLSADLAHNYNKYIESIDDLIDSLPPQKGAFVEAIARDYHYVSRDEWLEIQYYYIGDEDYDSIEE